MRVGVEHTVEDDLGQQPAQQRPGHGDPVESELVDEAPVGAEGDAVQALHHEHPLAAERFPQGRHVHGVVPPPGRGGGDAQHVPGLDPEVELFLHGAGEPIREVGGAEPASPSGAALQGAGDAGDDVHVALDQLADSGALHLHDDGLAGVQHGRVDLGDRRGRQRFGVELGEDVGPRPAQFLIEDALHVLPRFGRGSLLEPGQLIDEFGREQVSTGGQQLAELHERDPALFEGEAQRSRQLRSLALVAKRTSAAPVVRHEAVAKCDRRDLHVAAGPTNATLHGAPPRHEPHGRALRDERLGEDEEAGRHQHRQADLDGGEGPRVLRTRLHAESEDQVRRQTDESGQHRPRDPNP